MYLILILFLVCVVAAVILFASLVLYRIYDSVQPIEAAGSFPPLAKYLPSVSGIGWKALGTSFPSPVQKATVNGKSFYIKREDLTSPTYGGNKIRTMQFQIPAAEARLKTYPSAHFYVLGSYGSNQTVATLAFSSPELREHTTVCYVKPDEPDLDNTLNMLSCLSLCDRVFVSGITAAPTSGWVPRLLVSLFSPFSRDMGGNNVAGVLGQISAVFELAQQISSGTKRHSYSTGDCPDPSAIYVPVGSACTVTGLIIGTTLVRNHSTLNAFNHNQFKIVAVPISPAFAKLHKKYSYFTHVWSRIVPISPRSGIASTCRWLANRGGPKTLEPECIQTLCNNLEFITDLELIGEYGSHSEKSLHSARVADEKLECDGPNPWICGHFVAKPYALMMGRLENHEDGENVIFWHTKSITQPLGDCDEPDELVKLKHLVRREEARKPGSMLDWSRGEARSVLRPGKVDIENGNCKDYRHLMKQM